MLRNHIEPILQTKLEALCYDWFRDNFRLAGSLVGTYDEYKKNYNLTLKEATTENVIVNADISQGEEMESNVLSTNEFISNTTPTGSPLSYVNVLPFLPLDDTSNSYAGIINPALNSQPVISEYPQIDPGHFQSAVAENTVIDVEHINDPDFDDAVNTWSWSDTNINVDPNVGSVPPSGSFGSLFGSTGPPSVRRSSWPASYNSYIYQNINIVQGVTYSFTYRAKASIQGTTQMNVYINDNLDGTTYNTYGNYASFTNQHWTVITDSFTAGATGTMQFRIYWIGTAAGWLDHVRVTSQHVVPTPGIPAIPATQVDAWTEVSHGITDWTINNPGGTVEFLNSELQHGPENPSVVETYPAQIFDVNPLSSTLGQIINDPTGNTYSWYTPNPNGIIFHPDDPNNTLTPGIPVGYTTPTQIFDASNYSFIPGIAQPLLDDTLNIDCTGATNTTITLSQTLDVSTSDMQMNSWYMLDVVYDSSSITAPGIISTEGVLSAAMVAGLNPGDTGYPEGHLGTTLGSGEIQLVSTYPDSTDITKQYYTGSSPGQPTDTVYRAIFKIAALTNINTLTIKFKDFIGEIKGIWLNKLDALPSGGTIDAGWVSGGPNKYLWFDEQLNTQLHTLAVSYTHLTLPTNREV